ncbi:hypothetical protein OESDEN_02235 [Oesophagostomum dentatum]|uniref:Uncharacterized protein n=1 Tax=Oesophagostomum dentatum TaxID=61180 RepID=A0A0B1TQW4_OESDE|nr:hypothetical protein OESDEN_02235 [Oesophagostomum dentatum]
MFRNVTWGMRFVVSTSSYFLKGILLTIMQRSLELGSLLLARQYGHFCTLSTMENIPLARLFKTTSCVRWFSSRTTYCARGPSEKGDWFEKALASSYNVSPAVQCFARYCYPQSKLIFTRTNPPGSTPTVSSATSSTLRSTTTTTLPLTTYKNTSLSTVTEPSSDDEDFEIEDIEGIIMHLREAYIEELKMREEHEEEEALLFWSIIATSLFFSLFAVVAGYHSQRIRIVPLA